MNDKREFRWVSLRDLLDSRRSVGELASAIERGVLMVRDRFRRLVPADVGQIKIALDAVERHLAMTSPPDALEARELHYYWRDWHEAPIAGITDSGLYMNGDDIMTAGTRDATSPATADRVRASAESGASGAPVSEPRAIESRPGIAAQAREADDNAERRLPKAVSRFAAQNAEILALLRQHGHDPSALVRPARGKPGVKKTIRDALGNKGLWVGKTVFDKAWERLTKDGGDIAYKD